jgi:BASS family bile acid:Na+ symporter
MAIFVQYTLLVSIFCLMLGAGLRISFSEATAVLRQPRLVVLGLLANFVVVPILIYLSIRWLPISPDVKIGIMLMAAAPVAPMAPLPFVGIAKGNLPYSVGLMILAAALSVPLIPLILALAAPKSEAGLEIDVWQIVQTLVTVQLIPIAIGMTVCQASPTWKEKLLKVVPKIGQTGLLVAVVFILAAESKQIVSVGLVGHLISLGLVVVCLVVGHLMLGGETPDKRRALAVSTAIRNIPIAFLIANQNFPGTAVAGVALVFSVFSMIVSVVYGKLAVRSEGQGSDVPGAD